MSACEPTPAQREAVLEGLVRKFAVEAEALRGRAQFAGQDRETVEREVLEVLDLAIGRMLSEYAPEGREARVIKRVHVGLRLEIRRHFAGEDH